MRTNEKSLGPAAAGDAAESMLGRFSRAVVSGRLTPGLAPDAANPFWTAALNEPPALGRFLEDYLVRLLVPCELPAIVTACGHAQRGELRELLAYDQSLAAPLVSTPFAAPRPRGRSWRCNWRVCAPCGMTGLSNAIWRRLNPARLMAGTQSSMESRWRFSRCRCARGLCLTLAGNTFPHWLRRRPNPKTSANQNLTRYSPACWCACAQPSRPSSLAIAAGRCGRKARCLTGPGCNKTRRCCWASRSGWSRWLDCRSFARPKNSGSSRSLL